MSRHTRTRQTNAPSQTAAALPPPPNGSNASAIVSLAEDRVPHVEERLLYAYNKLSAARAALLAMTDPGEGGVPYNTAAVFDGIEDLMCDVLLDLHAISAALHSQDAYTSALIARAPEVH